MPYSYEEVRKAPGGSEGQLPKVSIKQRNWEGGSTWRLKGWGRVMCGGY